MQRNTHHALRWMLLAASLVLISGGADAQPGNNPRHADRVADRTQNRIHDRARNRDELRDARAPLAPITEDELRRRLSAMVVLGEEAQRIGTQALSRLEDGGDAREVGDWVREQALSGGSELLRLQVRQWVRERVGERVRTARSHGSESTKGDGSGSHADTQVDPPTDEEILAVLAIADPEAAEGLAELRSLSAEQAGEKFDKLRQSRRLREMVRHRRNDPEMFEARTKEFLHLRRVHEAARDLRAAKESQDPERIDRAESVLRERLGEQHELRLSVRAIELERFREELARRELELQQQIESNDAREEWIDQRIDRVLERSERFDALLGREQLGGRGGERDRREHDSTPDRSDRRRDARRR